MAQKEALETYNRKRDFKVTSEPPGEIEERPGHKPVFVVQKHDATRLHYDFRLEWDGVLWSWAVPKGPSYYPRDKRLAMRTEDHPLDYADFEGIIPEKQYGAGPVMLWDKGAWEPLEDDPARALKKGKLTFRLKGEKLKGEWTLARMNKDEKRESWLLIKHTDDKAIGEEDKSFLARTDYSVKTGRTFGEIARHVANVPSARADKKEPVKRGIADLKNLMKKYDGVQLATLVDTPPQTKNWAHEVKYDGYRILAFVQNGEVRIRTRNGHEWTDRFPILARALAGAAEAGDFVIDGEALILDEKGLSNFQLLQNALGTDDARLRGYFFDLLYWNGEDFSSRPFSERREALERLFAGMPEGPPLFLSETLPGKADAIIRKACELGLEGIVSKKLNAPYVAGRTKSWLKSKCDKRQEFVICGFVPATDVPKAIGSLHLGYYRDGSLLYAGKVGTGFNERSARELYGMLSDLEAPAPPFDERPKGNFNNTVWVKPDRLCEVKFGMWTDAGKIRHASYQGLRADKPPQEVTHEEPVPSGQLQQEARRMNSKASKGKAVVGGVAISHPEREIFPAAHITKVDLAGFYDEMAALIVPMIARRPISVVRCPGGIDKQCFFQRSRGKGMPEHIYKIDVTHNGNKHDYIYIKDERGLIELVQMGVIEIHPWGSRIDGVDKPDRIIFDLDPAQGVPFEAVKLAAQHIKARLDDIGLMSFLKVTGGKGLHVTIPITRRHNWEVIKRFSREFARQMVDEVPEAYTLNMAKKKRAGKIFIDYLRNDFSATAVMDYCVRARPGAAVAVPLGWDELSGLKAPDGFSMEDAHRRLAKGKALLEEYSKLKQSLGKSLLEKFS